MVVVVGEAEAEGGSKSDEGERDGGMKDWTDIDYNSPTYRSRIIKLHDVKWNMLERIGRRDYVSEVGWSNRKLESLMVAGDIPRHSEDSDDPLEQLRHLILWMEVNVAFFSVVINFVLLGPDGKKIKELGMPKHCWSNIFLGLRLKKHKWAIQEWEIDEDEDSTEKLNVYGLNEEQWQIPVIDQLIVSKPEGGYKVLGYMVNRVVKAHVYNDEAGNDPDSYHCQRCYAWYGSKWRFCEQCCLNSDDLKRELRDHQEGEYDSCGENDDIEQRYKTWYRRKRRGAKKYKM